MRNEFSRCYCDILAGHVLCIPCQEDLIRLYPEELIGSGCYCEADNMCSAHARRITRDEANRLHDFAEQQVLEKEAA